MHKSDSDASAHPHVHTLTRARVPSPSPRTKTCNPNVCADGAWTVYGCPIHAHTCTHSHERGCCRLQHALKPAIPTCAQMAPGLWVGVTKVPEYPSFPTTQVAMRWSESDGLLTIATSRDSVQPLVVAEQGTICTRSTNAVPLMPLQLSNQGLHTAKSCGNLDQEHSDAWADTHHTHLPSINARATNRITPCRGSRAHTSLAGAQRCLG
jgi:hypothetical protein